MAADDDIADTKVNLGVPNIKKKILSSKKQKKSRWCHLQKKKEEKKTFLSDTRNFSVNPDYDILLFFVHCSLSVYGCCASLLLGGFFVVEKKN